MWTWRLPSCPAIVSLAECPLRWLFTLAAWTGQRFCMQTPGQISTPVHCLLPFHKESNVNISKFAYINYVLLSCPISLSLLNEANVLSGVPTQTRKPTSFPHLQACDRSRVLISGTLGFLFCQTEIRPVTPKLRVVGKIDKWFGGHLGQIWSPRAFPELPALSAAHEQPWGISTY